MKLLYTFCILMVVTACQEKTSKELGLEKDACSNVVKTFLAKVDGCSVYDVRADVWDEDGQVCKKHSYSGSAYFMYTSCPKDSVKWDCGKNCTMNNTTQEE